MSSKTSLVIFVGIRLHQNDLKPLREHFSAKGNFKRLSFVRGCIYENVDMEENYVLLGYENIYPAECLAVEEDFALFETQAKIIRQELKGAENIIDPSTRVKLFFLTKDA